MHNQIRTMMKRMSPGFLFLVLLFTAKLSYSATFTSNASGQWNDAAPTTWTITGSDSDGIPDSDDDVIIAAGDSINLQNGSFSCNSITLHGYFSNHAGNLSTTSMTVSEHGYLNTTNEAATITITTLTLAGGTIQGEDAGSLICTDLVVTGHASMGKVDLSANGTTTVNDTLTFTSKSGDHFFHKVVIGSGGFWNNSINETIWISDSLEMNGGAFHSGTARYVMTGSTVAVSGTSSSIAFDGNWRITGTLTNLIDTLELNAKLVGTGTLINGANKVLVLQDAIDLPNLTATAVGNTVMYSGNIAQSGKATDYYNLTIANTGSGVTFAGNADVSNTLDIQQGILIVDGATTELITQDLTMATGTEYRIETTSGTPILPQVTGTANLSTGSLIHFNGNSIQRIRSTLTYQNVQISNQGDKKMDGNLDIDGDLTLSGNASFNATSSNYTLNLGGDWTITTSASDPFQQRSGTVIFDGTSSQSLSSPLTTETFYNLTIANSGNTLTLNDSVEVDNLLTFSTSGYLDLNGYTLTLDNWSNGNIPNLSTDRLILANGDLVVNDLNQSETAQFPLSFSTASTGFCRVDIGNNDASNTSFRVSACNSLNTTGTCSGGTPISTAAVNITWDISTASTDADVTFYWDASNELSSFDRNDCFVAHYGSYWGDPYSARQAASNLSGTTYSTSANQQAFSPFAIGSGTNSPLPIDLLYFEATLHGDQVRLNWATATEINNDFFTIERSTDAENWEALLVKDGAGHSSQKLNYEAFDASPLAGTAYYRLKQTDFDGSTTYSQIETIHAAHGVVVGIAAFPNPFTDLLIVEAGRQDLGEVAIYDSMGRKVKALGRKTPGFSSRLSFDLKGLSSGLYFVRSAAEVIQVVKQ